MSKLMSEREIKEWETEQEKGSFSFIIEEAIKFTPLFLLPRPFIYYFWGEQPFGFGKVFEWIFESFFTSFAVCTFLWFSQQRSYKKSFFRNLNKNQ
jgi:hypothetical protein